MNEPLLNGERRVGFFSKFIRSFLIKPVYILACVLSIPMWKKSNYMKFLYANPSEGNTIVTTEHPKPSPDHLRIVCISDVHRKWKNLTLAKGDILIVAGDIVDIFSTPERDQLREFNEWLGTLAFKHKIVIGGNHDLHLYHIGKEEATNLLSNATYLEDSSVNIEGLLIYGCPTSVGNKKYTAFQHKPKSKQLKEQLEMIPEDVDILITHGPPKGFNDAQKGCEDLTEIVMKKKPRFHVFGHIHQSHGVHFYKHNSKEQTTFINAAYLNSLFLPSHLPVAFDIAPRKPVILTSND